MERDFYLKDEYLQYVEELKNDPRIKRMKCFIHHRFYSAYDHTLRVVMESIKAASKSKYDYDMKSLILGAFLHDYFLYDWRDRNSGAHLHAFTHPKKALKNATNDFATNEVVEDIIKAHMWPLTIKIFPRSKEAKLVCKIDKIVAFKECLQPRRKRLKHINRNFEHIKRELITGVN